MSFYEKLLPKYLIHENSKYQHFFISEKTAPTFFTLYSKGRHFNITMLDILIFCNMLHHEMDF